MKKLFLLVCGLGLLFSACSQKTETTSRQRLVLSIPTDPATLDPRKGGDIVSSLFHFLLFDGMTRLDDEGNVAPSFAKNVDISEDNTIYTFHLTDAVWSNKTPITAWDFEKSWKDILHPEFPSMNAHLLYPIKNAEGAKLGTASLSEVGIRCLDAKTLQVTLERPTPYFLELVAFCVFYPINAEIDHSHPEWDQRAGKTFVASGPFTLKEWRRNNEIILKKNPHYHRADDVVIEEIQLNIVDSEMTALQLFEKGETDIIGQPLMPLPTDAIPELLTKVDLKIIPVPATTFCSFNVDAYPFTNAHIRKAFAYAIDRSLIVQNITQLNEPPALGIIPPILKKYESPNAFFKDGDLAGAQQELAKGLEELGIPKLPKINYLYAKSESHHKIAQALQQQWQEVLGVEIKLQCVEKKHLMHLLKNRDYMAAQSFWMAQYKDPMNIFERFKSKHNVKNYPNWENPAFGQILEASNEARTAEERYALLEQAEALFLEEMPLAPIYHWNSAYITHPHIKSFGTAPIGNGFFDRVYIQKDSQVGTCARH